MYPRVCREMGQGDGGDGAVMTQVMVIAEAMGKMILIVNGYGAEFEKTVRDGGWWC